MFKIFFLGGGGMKYNISRELEPVYHSNFGVNGTKMKKVNNMNSNQSFTEWLKVKKKIETIPLE